MGVHGAGAGLERRKIPQLRAASERGQQSPKIPRITRYDVITEAICHQGDHCINNIAGPCPSAQLPYFLSHFQIQRHDEASVDYLCHASVSGSSPGLRHNGRRDPLCQIGACLPE